MPLHGLHRQRLGLGRHPLLRVLPVQGHAGAVQLVGRRGLLAVAAGARHSPRVPGNPGRLGAPGADRRAGGRPRSTTWRRAGRSSSRRPATRASTRTRPRTTRPRCRTRSSWRSPHPPTPTKSGAARAAAGRPKSGATQRPVHHSIRYRLAAAGGAAPDAARASGAGAGATTAPRRCTSRRPACKCCPRAWAACTSRCRARPWPRRTWPARPR